MVIKTKIYYVLVLLWVLASLNSCNTKKGKSDLDIEFINDTLCIGYTYWQTESGPFIGYCGDELALTFSGTIVEISEPTNVAGPLYTSQKGTIAIENMYKIQELGTNTYANQKFISVDCFYGLDLNAGDKVLVSCYNYEGDYTIAGKKSILKIDNLDAPIIQSIKTYIDNDQNPIPLKKDKALWAAYDLDESLEKIITCAEELQTMKHENKTLK